MPAVKGAKQTKEEIARLKTEFLSFYQDCPVKKLGAMYIMRSHDTITQWEHEDPDFSLRVQEAKAKFARKNLLKTNADWKLSRLMGEYFKEPDQNIKLQVLPILSGASALPGNNSNSQSLSTQEAS